MFILILLLLLNKFVHISTEYIIIITTTLFYFYFLRSPLPNDNIVLLLQSYLRYLYLSGRGNESRGEGVFLSSALASFFNSDAAPTRDPPAPPSDRARPYPPLAPALATARGIISSTLLLLILPTMYPL